MQAGNQLRHKFSTPSALNCRSWTCTKLFWLSPDEPKQMSNVSLRRHGGRENIPVDSAHYETVSRRQLQMLRHWGEIRAGGTRRMLYGKQRLPEMRQLLTYLNANFHITHGITSHLLSNSCNILKSKFYTSPKKKTGRGQGNAYKTYEQTGHTPKLILYWDVEWTELVITVLSLVNAISVGCPFFRAHSIRSFGYMMPNVLVEKAAYKSRVERNTQTTH
jgi:hypothetical protein